jgi:hypothetical protein
MSIQSLEIKKTTKNQHAKEDIISSFYQGNSPSIQHHKIKIISSKEKSTFI